MPAFRDDIFRDDAFRTGDIIVVEDINTKTYSIFIHDKNNFLLTNKTTIDI